MGLSRGMGPRVVLAVVALHMVACATMGDPPPTLYKRLGGREGIALVVGDFVTNMAGDSRVNARFKDMKGPEAEKLKSNLADQICDATGGPCSYLGRDMKTTHKGMKITDSEWNATVENLVKALDKNKVDPKDKTELLGVLAPMKADIVGQ
ncbi:MAG TPA: group 1 truncated hemoglobin [Methylomirabilota bacterium]|nr:group 1 truncated hemoglobin [Methylomirabilota bacterium]